MHPPFFSKWNWYNCLTLKREPWVSLFVNPQKSPYQNLSPKTSHYKISNPKKVLRSQISNPKKGLRTSPSLIYLSTPPGILPFLFWTIVIFLWLTRTVIFSVLFPRLLWPTLLATMGTMRFLLSTLMFSFRWRLRLLRVPNRFFGIRDLTYLKAGIRDFSEKGERDSGL